MPIRRAEPYLRWLPFAVMGAIALIDLLAGPDLGYLPLLALGPAFASLSCGIRRTALIGLLAFGLGICLSYFDRVLGTHQNDLTLASIVGVTAAAMLASAGRLQRERELATVRDVAEVAQRVLLRPVPRSAGPVHVAVRYTSASAEARIGGDLYEVVTAPSGVRIIVGDVQGKGLEAVETAAAVLGAFREAAHDEADLTAVVARLERTLARLLLDEKFVTAVLCEFGPEDRFTLVNCGHPPPLMIHEGRTWFAEVKEPTPPLGMISLADPVPCPQEFPFPPGDQVLLYTDGVTEARDRAGRFYPLEERAYLLKCDDAEEALTNLEDDLLHYVGGPIADDAAMLLVRRQP